MKSARYPAEFEVESVKQVTACVHGVVDAAK